MKNLLIVIDVWPTWACQAIVHYDDLQQHNLTDRPGFWVLFREQRRRQG
jgi:hypothetical protein